MVRVIHACCVLHNIANMQDLHYFEPQLNEEDSDIELQNRPIVMIDNAREYEDDVRGTHVRMTKSVIYYLDKKKIMSNILYYKFFYFVIYKI